VSRVLSDRQLRVSRGAGKEQAVFRPLVYTMQNPPKSSCKKGGRKPAPPHYAKGLMGDFPSATRWLRPAPCNSPENGVGRTRFCVARLWGYIGRPLRPEYLAVPITPKKRTLLSLDIYRYEIYHYQPKETPWTSSRSFSVFSCIKV
jgi:hypothetical protein